MKSESSMWTTFNPGITRVTVSVLCIIFQLFQSSTHYLLPTYSIQGHQELQSQSQHALGGSRGELGMVKLSITWWAHIDRQTEGSTWPYYMFPRCLSAFPPACSDLWDSRFHGGVNTTVNQTPQSSIGKVNHRQLLLLSYQFKPWLTFPKRCGLGVGDDSYSSKCFETTRCCQISHRQRRPCSDVRMYSPIISHVCEHWCVLVLLCLCLSEHPAPSFLPDGVSALERPRCSGECVRTVRERTDGEKGKVSEKNGVLWHTKANPPPSPGSSITHFITQGQQFLFYVTYRCTAQLGAPS